MTEDELLELSVKLKGRYSYDPETGLFTRLKGSGRDKIGSVVKTKSVAGYIRIGLDNKTYMAHRLAFLYMTGSWPVGDVDHKDTVRDNNKWENLRDVTKEVNGRNRSIHKNNTSGHAGVSWNKSESKWQAYIYLNGKVVGLGKFTHKEDAIFARMTAEKENGHWLDRVWDQL